MHEAFTTFLLVVVTLYSLGVVVTLIVGAMTWALAVDSLKRANTDEFAIIANKLRREARAELAEARSWLRAPFLWPWFLGAYVKEMRSVVSRDKEDAR